MTLQERIKSKQDKIAKQKAKMDKMQSVWKAGKLYMGYMSEEDEWPRQQRELAYLEKELAALLDQENLKKEQEASRGEKVQIILDYLEIWKQKVTGWYKDKFENFKVKARKEFEEMNKLRDVADSAWNQLTKEDKEALNIKYGGSKWSSRGRESTEEYKAYSRAVENFQGWSDLSRYTDRFHLFEKAEFNWDMLDKDLTKEKERKYNDLIDRVLPITGQITDASHLSIGNQTGEINGYIIGKRGKAEVNTISASGPIQCFHYRVLVKEIK